MAVQQLQQTVRRLRAAIAAPLVISTDSELLHAFSARADQDAFAELIRRHGRMVQAVGRRVLGNSPAVDDVWQATFLLLARRARSLHSRSSVAGWLHGAAYRIALNERRATRRRTAREAGAPAAITPSVEREAAWRELQERVGEGVRRMTARLREVFVRCCLQTEGCAEVASEIGVNAATVRSRLARARRIIRARLERKGVCLSAALTLAAVSGDRVSASLAAGTTRAAHALAAGRPLPGELVSKQALVLAAGARGGFGATHWACAAVVGLAAIVGLGLMQLPARPADPPSPKALVSAAETQPARAEVVDSLPARAIVRFGTTRFRTGNMVGALAFSPDGKRLASWGQAMYQHDEFALWDAETGKEVRSVRTLERTLLALAWPADGPGVAVLKNGESFAGNRVQVADLTVWDFSSEPGTPLPKGTGGPRAFAGAAGPATSPSYDAAAVSADGKRLAVATSVGGKPDAVLVFELKPAQSVKALKRLAALDAPPSTCKALAFSPDGKRLTGACTIEKDGKPLEKGTLVVWDAKGKIARTVETPDGAVQWGDFTLSASNKFAALGLGDGDTFLMDLDSGSGRTIHTKHRASFRFGGAGVFAIAFTPDGKSLATAGSDGMVRITDVAGGNVRRELGRHYSTPQAVAFAADGKRLASAGQDGVIRVWDPATGKEAVPTGGHGMAVWRASLSRDGKTVLTDANDGTIRLWDAATGKERARIVPKAAVTSSRLSPDGRHVIAVVGDWDAPNKTLKVWDAATGADATPPGFPKPLAASGFQFTPDGKTMIAYDNNKLSAWAWPDGKKLWAADMPKPVKQPGTNHVSAVSVSPDGRHFITVAERSWYREDKGLKFGYGADGVVDLWETASGKRVRRLVEAESCFRPGIYAADGSYIHSGGGTLPGDVRGGSPFKTNARLCVIDPLTGRLVREFGPSGRNEGFDSGFTLALSADGKVLFRPTQVGEILVYEVATGQFRTALTGHGDMVLALDTPTDVRRLLSGSKDTTALLWDVGFGAAKGRPIPADERSKAWDSLVETNGKAAYAAMANLAGDPAGFVTLAAGQLKPAPTGPTAEDLDPIFRDLDSKAFARREAASAKLEKYGESAMALVRARLETEISAEVRERLIRFLEKCDGPKSVPERLRQSRAIELLEHLGTPEAQALLEKLAQGGPSRLTTEAAGALKRLRER